MRWRNTWESDEHCNLEYSPSDKRHHSGHYVLLFHRDIIVNKSFIYETRWILYCPHLVQGNRVFVGIPLRADFITEMVTFNRQRARISVQGYQGALLNIRADLAHRSYEENIPQCLQAITFL